jgi:hypothetical protein
MEKKRLELVMTNMNMLWCHLTLPTHLLSFNIWWMIFLWIFGWFCGMLQWWHPHLLREHGRPWTPCTSYLEKFWEVGFYTKLEKCEFHQSKVEFFGYVISWNGICKDLCEVRPLSTRLLQFYLKCQMFSWIH